MTNQYNVPVSQKVTHTDSNFYLGYYDLAKMLLEKTIDIEKALKLVQRGSSVKPHGPSL
jgi:hypothetical protein